MNQSEASERPDGATSPGELFGQEKSKSFQRFSCRLLYFHQKSAPPLLRPGQNGEKDSTAKKGLEKTTGVNSLWVGSLCWYVAYLCVGGGGERGLRRNLMILISHGTNSFPSFCLTTLESRLRLLPNAWFLVVTLPLGRPGPLVAAGCASFRAKPRRVLRELKPPPTPGGCRFRVRSFRKEGCWAVRRSVANEKKEIPPCPRRYLPPRFHLIECAHISPLPAASCSLS